MKVSQCRLKNKDKIMVCYLDSKRIKIGDSVRLKDSENPEVWWEIISKGHSIEDSSIHDDHESVRWFQNDYRRKLTGLNIKK